MEATVADSQHGTDTPSYQTEKAAIEAHHLERASSPEKNLMYAEDDEEPEIHIRTYLAVAAMFLLNLVQVFALQGPPVVVSLACSRGHNP